MKSIRVAICGLGNVGRRLLELMEAKRETLRQNYDLELLITGGCDSSGAVLHQQMEGRAILAAKQNRRRHLATWRTWNEPA